MSSVNAIPVLSSSTQKHTVRRCFTEAYAVFDGRESNGEWSRGCRWPAESLADCCHLLRSSGDVM